MDAPGSRGLLGRLPVPVGSSALGVDLAAARAGLSASERELGRVLVVGAASASGLRKLGLPEPVVLADRGVDRSVAPPGGTVVRGDPGALPLARETVDAVVVMATPWTTGHEDGVVEEAARVLRPGGVLVVGGVDPSTVRGRAMRALGFLRGREPTLLTPGEVTARMAAAGLAPSLPRARWTYAAAGVFPRGSANP
jgi:demethylmenaquinone methyltransferase/2-methoxy-6-polyprenyl-1,4-benzoquinol methylase